MHTLYLDTEFTSLTADYRLISLALVDPHGAEFYVELSDGWAAADCSEFVQKVVLPQLDLARHGHSRREASAALQQFLQGYSAVEVVSRHRLPPVRRLPADRLPLGDGGSVHALRHDPYGQRCR